MIYLGVDPGVTGAFVLYNHANREIMCVWDMPSYKVPSKPRKRARYRDKLDNLSADIHRDKIAIGRRNKLDPVGVFDVICLAKDLGAEKTIVEDVAGRPGQSGMFQFGFGAGLIRMALIAQEMPYEMVSPARWKSEMRLSQIKNESVIKAEQIFPTQRHWFRGPKGGLLSDRAEAALLARFGAYFLLDED